MAPESTIAGVGDDREARFEQALGRLWVELKPHPKLLCSLQDDDFTLPFRPVGGRL